MKRKVIAVDFDGTLCEDRYPEIGAPREKVIDRLKQERYAGARLILWTCRTGTQLDDAISWCANQAIYFDAVNANLPDMVNQYGNDSRKVNATEYWDDKAVRV